MEKINLNIASKKEFVCLFDVKISFKKFEKKLFNKKSSGVVGFNLLCKLQLLLNPK